MSKRHPVAHALSGALALMGALLVTGCPKEGGSTAASKEDPNVKALRTQMGYIDSQIRVYATTERHAPRPDEGLGVIFAGQIPVDPWGYPIQYIVPGPGGAAFDLMSYGADGAPGGKKENADLLWSQLRQ
jgi:type II secretory pathway pseudopilin PulG